MPLQLPPKSAAPNEANAKALDDALTSVIAGHPGSVQPWTFYEVLDDYLGPWKPNGYPIAYGKYYCIAFNENDDLQSDPQAREWVRKTTIALQEPLRDFVVARFRKGTLPSLTEAELRAFAFSVHPQAYLKGGLTMVALTSPKMVPIIASIPCAEFNPTSKNFKATIAQVVTTMKEAIPQAAGITLAAMVPAHSGLFRNAARRDELNFRQEVALNRWLIDTRRQLDSGKLDDFAALNEITARLNATQFDDQGLARAARELINAIDGRKRALAKYYREQLSRNPTLGPSIDRLQPGWRNCQ